MVNNLDWTGKLTAVDFLRDLGKHFSVNVMLARDTVRRRLESDGMSYTEFSYMLLQANDYLQLHREYGCALQVGGSDQWGNIIAGVDLTRRVDGHAVHAMTVPLVTSSDGKKFGKSTGGGSLWLDPEIGTTPYAWSPYSLTFTADADAIRYLEVVHMTLGSGRNQPNSSRPRPIRRVLAGGAATVGRGDDHAGARPGEHRCGGDRQPGAVRPRRAGQPRRGHAGRRRCRRPRLRSSRRAPAPTDRRELLVATGLSEGNKAARRTIKEGGAYVNNVKITSRRVDAGRTTDLLHGASAGGAAGARRTWPAPRVG